LLADFHSRADTSPEIDEAASPDAVRANWEESFADLRTSVGDVLDAGRRERVEALVDRYLDGRARLFEARIAGGHIRDGHGDLQAADVFCLDDGPRVLDCIEFNERFRHGDVMADVAFLAMDLERLGSPDLAVRFLDWYREFAAETCPASLVHHYIAYRAHVRCKVACHRASQLSGAAAAAAAAEANGLLELAERHLLESRVRLVLVGGLPGTGKSTLALGLGAGHDWTVLRSDEVRKELAGVAATHRSGDPFLQGLYDPSVTERVYGEMLRRAEASLRLGESVVLDASWTSDRERRRARQAAARAGADLVELRCIAPTHIAEERLLERLVRGDDPSDADPAIAAHLDELTDPWPESVAIETSGTPADASARAEAVLAAACSPAATV
jgi:predicted kinase